MPGPFLSHAARPDWRFDLLKEQLTVGRDSKADLQIDEQFPDWDTVSNYHARLERRGARWVVLDGWTDGQPSTNGILVNRKRTRENYLEDNFTVGFGNVEFQFHLPPSETTQGVNS
ncbi:MAG: FHA domain-containing protein [Anaerolineae bacterium]